jgi:hypothetical protein
VRRLIPTPRHASLCARLEQSGARTLDESPSAAPLDDHVDQRPSTTPGQLLPRPLEFAVTVYDLHDNHEYVRNVQHATLHRADAGLDPNPALFGSPEWWTCIEDGSVPSRTLDGIVGDVRRESMGDWPGWTFRAANGDESDWTREGDHTRYVTGLRARITTATVRWKPGVATVQQFGEQPEHDVLIRVDLEPSDERSAALGPGPFPGAYDDSESVTPDPRTSPRQDAIPSSFGHRIRRAWRSLGRRGRRGADGR